MDNNNRSEYDRRLNDGGHFVGLIRTHKDDVERVTGHMSGRIDQLPQTEAVHFRCEFHGGRVGDDVEMDVDIAQNDVPAVVNNDHFE